MKKYIYGCIIVLAYTLMIGYTYQTLPVKLQSFDRHPYVIYQDEKYYGGIGSIENLWYSLNDGFIVESEVPTGIKYEVYRKGWSIIDGEEENIISFDDIEVGSCDDNNVCTDYDLLDAYAIEDIQEVTSILTIVEPNDPIIFKNANLQSFLLIETFLYIFMIYFLLFGLMNHDQAKMFLSSLQDYFEKIRFLKDVEHTKKRVFIAHRGSLILGIGIFIFLVYAIIAMYML